MTTMSTPMPVAPRAKSVPISGTERIVSIDVLRGFALLGILLLNIQSFSMPGAAYMNPTSYGDFTGANYWVWYFTHLLGDAKFMSIFSMLFGAGIVVMTTRAEQRTGKSAAVHYRRMGWLIAFGLLHAHLLWYGDILYSYGMCGLLAYLFRRMKPATLLTIGIVGIVIGCLVTFMFYAMYHVIPEEGRVGWEKGMQAMWSPTAEELQSELDIYRGGWLGQAPHRSMMAGMFETLFLFIMIIWRVLGLMLVGMGLFKLGVFSAARSKLTYTLLALVGIGVGAMLTLMEMTLVQRNDWPMIDSMYLYSQLHYWGSCFQAVGYVGFVMLVCKVGVLQWLQHALGAVGRMALSNYLLQTIICTTLFYGHGFGQFGSFSRVEQLYVFLAMSVAQLVWSPIWLKAFRFGPFEWLWRSLTYWRPQPMLRSSTPTDKAQAA